MDADETFRQDFMHREMWQRVYESEPELVEDYYELAAEFGLHEHPGDPRRSIEAQKRATATERGRDIISDLSHALIRAANEVHDELRGVPARSAPQSLPLFAEDEEMEASRSPSPHKPELEPEPEPEPERASARTARWTYGDPFDADVLLSGLLREGGWRSSGT